MVKLWDENRRISPSPTTVTPYLLRPIRSLDQALADMGKTRADYGLTDYPAKAPQCGDKQGEGPGKTDVSAC